MDWTLLATRLALYIALGYWLGLLVLGPAPVGKFFYRLAGWTAALAAAAAAALALAAGWPDAPAERVRVLAVLATLLPAPWYASHRPARRRAGVLAALACGLAALAASAYGPDGLGVLQLLSDACAAAVAGGVCFAMVFGHAYLTVPKLPFQHLLRVHRFATLALAARLLLSGLVLALAWPRLHAGTQPLFDPFDWLDLSVRFLVGLLVPLLFAGMVHSALRWKSNQSATGILYASTVLVWIGEAVALHLGRQWRVPL
ncbi:MAG: hypothetical protein EYC70_06210 [Planctomycetota bacterium]|nr:MAG: hypothetical protein EYC70_06210 [Planctomycetota bacterium]